MKLFIQKMLGLDTLFEKIEKCIDMCSQLVKELSEEREALKEENMQLQATMAAIVKSTGPIFVHDDDVAIVDADKLTTERHADKVLFSYKE